MKDALQSLPCVESDSVKIDYDKKEARFTVKKDSSCNLDELKQVVQKTGRGKIAEVKPATN